MSESAVTGTVPVPTTARARPPVGTVGPVAWLRANLFNSWWSSAITILLGYLLVRWGVGFIDWAVVSAIWSVPTGATGQPDATVCRAAEHAGACWAVIGDKYRFILFGRFPYDEQWRPALCVAIFIALFAISANRRFWRKELALVWIAALGAIGVLMWGGVLGMEYVPQDVWGGLPLTLILATFGLAFAFPLSVLVALGRRSTSLPAVRLLCVLYVELIRGVPLISLLFMASVMFPLFMPVGMNPDKLLRAQIAIVLFAGAYLAEVVRGGLQALPKGQYEAADALGLSYWKKTWLIILPQALRLVIPPLVNTFIGFFKDTSLVLIIGIFDLLTAGKVAMSDPTWQGFSTEVYLFLGVIYFAFCYAMSRYSRGLERDYARARGR
ncbi:putative ABC transporter membrane subunit YhdY [Rhodovastum atsumiense]|uniref:Amino acid ABC transporter permease n=1 Tax=Rhodovastum atsumiense TaxID=504468 RepID=A0A5M6IQF3_9PROT|nr:amino acid ABC transporter permease [Rhodovastum atsumiense]KAA5610503.1 amino acid ABC transporter permease [Rhodovastum atsumiense]CAH2600490.1 putative ABC transporter membrane subunit YhdY [Rhodovastum atsumiense]